jgi:lysozyme
MRMSPEGRRRLIKREGKRNKAYRDTKGIWTIGVGHTSAAGPPEVTPGLTLSNSEVDAVFARDLLKYEAPVNAAIHVPLGQHEFDALVSLCFNIGPSAFMRSTVVKRLNAGDRQGAADAFSMWNKPPEIMGRRNDERLQFLTPYKPLGSPVAASAAAGTTGTGVAGAGALEALEPSTAPSGNPGASDALTSAADAVNSTATQLTLMGVLKWLSVALIVIGMGLTAYALYRKLNQ